MWQGIVVVVAAVVFYGLRPYASALPRVLSEASAAVAVFGEFLPLEMTERGSRTYLEMYVASLERQDR